MVKTDPWGEPLDAGELIALISNLRRLQDVGPRDRSLGICANVSSVSEEQELCAHLIEVLYKTAFPVEPPASYIPPPGEPPNKTLFQECVDCWIGEYGENRRRFLARFIRDLELMHERLVRL